MLTFSLNAMKYG